MARKSNFIEDDYDTPEVDDAPKSLFKKNSDSNIEESDKDVQVRVVSENELLHLRLNEINIKLDEILKIAKQ